MTSSARNSSAAPFNQLDQLFAAPMFVASMLFLLLTGATLHLDLGHVLEMRSWAGCVVGPAVLYPLFVMGTIIHCVAGAPARLAFANADLSALPARPPQWHSRLTS